MTDPIPTRPNATVDRLVLAVMALAIVIPRLLMSIFVTDFGADGSYYTNVAQNVRDGNGVATDISVFHQAFPSFPHPTSVYPIWPLVYGGFAKLAPIEVVGVWLPTTLYFVAVLLAYAIGHRMVPQRLFQALPLNGGHVLALLFSLNTELSMATSRPYTEGLAFVLLFALLLRAPALWRRLGPVAGLELGLWLIVLFLTRSQFVVVGIAAAMAAVVAGARRPRDTVTFALGAVVSVGVVWSLYARWLATFLPDPSLGIYLRFDLARVSNLLSAVPVMAETTSPLDRILDLLQGFGYAFSLHNTTSTYQSLHHASAYAMPIAAVVLLTRWRRWPVVRRLLRLPSGPNSAFFLLVALGLTASLHTVHKVYGSSWVFGGRHAIPSILLVTTSLLYLIRSRTPIVHVLGAALLAATLYGSWRELVLRAGDQVTNAMRGPSLREYRVQLRGWLESERERLGGLVVAVERPEAQRLSWQTPGVGFHWMTDTTTVEDLTVMVRELGVRYVVVFDNVDNVQFVDEPEFRARFTLAETFKEDGATEDGEPRLRARPTRVFAPRCTVFPDAPTCQDPPPFAEPIPR